jgi:exodeoxyribonuclease V beta subunit
MSEPLPFDANRLSLEPGLRLLEASAGTGKTFALAHLVLRLVGEQGHPLPRLLVVTFTDAATAELRDRISQRLQEALANLEDPARDPPDAVLATWLQERREASAPELSRLRGRLLLALEELDSADITTIHGFCRRTLSRQALEAGRSPDLQLEGDGEIRIRQVVHDYAQRQLLPLPADLLAGLRAAGVHPGALEAVLFQLDGDPALALDPPPADLPDWEEPLPRWLPALVAERWERFRDLWEREGRELEQCLCQEAARWRQEAGATNTTPYAARPTRDRCGELAAWIAAQPPQGSYRAVRRQELLSRHYHPGAFSQVARRIERPEGGEVRLPRPALLEAIAALVDGPAELVRLHAAQHGRRELRRRRQRQGVVTYSQLLADLDPGAEESGATALLEAVAGRYAAALVDEFQDTDPIQWRILRQAFGGGRHPLLIVGDPKQAIYRFRGGDLATYLRVRAEAKAVHELGENRRSTEALIGGLNALMQPGLQRSKLPVQPLRACAGRRGPEPPQAPIELLWLGEPGQPAASRTALEAWLAPRLATFVVELLERGLELVDGQGRRPLQPDDICLLVDRHRQAETLRQALERQGVASRLVSRADVFQSQAATALQRLLDALADPADTSRRRLLAASPLLGWDPIRLSGDAQGDVELAGRLARLAEQLPQRGLLGLLADLLDGERIASLALDGRLLADLQQVGVLVQERIHGEQLGAEAAADWLRRLRLHPDRPVPEEHQAHSDRVDGAVSVVTIHRSKGLEYPVVICPTLWCAASASPSRGLARGGCRWQAPGQDAPRLDLHLDDRWGTGYRARREQRYAEEAERERQAYVAVTRARDLLVLAWGPAKGQQGGPLFPWLFGEPSPPDLDENTVAEELPDHWRGRLIDQIAGRALPLQLREPPPPDGPRWRRPLGEDRGALACGPVPLPQSIDRLWGRSSYSSWTQAAHAGGPGAPAALQAAPDDGRDTLDPEAEPEALPAVAEEIGPMAPAEELDAEAEDGPLAGFPRGAAAGDCLHRILERVEFTLPLESPANREAVERELRRAGLGAAWTGATLEGLTPFGGELGGLRPADLPSQARLAEMGFDLRMDLVRSADLASAFRAYPQGAFGAAYADRLAALPIASRGFLTGSIDLVFRAPAAGDDGRWWVLDWKSNWLGRRDGTGQPLACGPRHYAQAAMRELMAERHYPLQAHLYLVALHRYLGWRLDGYDPKRHLGGYAYVFLRGTPGPGTGAAAPGAVPGMMVERPPLARLLALDAALGGTAGGRPEPPSARAPELEEGW